MQQTGSRLAMESIYFNIVVHDTTVSYKSSKRKNTILHTRLETIPRAEIAIITSPTEEPSRLSAGQLYTLTGSRQRMREAARCVIDVPIYQGSRAMERKDLEM